MVAKEREKYGNLRKNITADAGNRVRKIRARKCGICSKRTDEMRHSRDAHKEIEEIFRKILPQYDMTVREQQVELCHIMYDCILERKLALCEAGVRNGKTFEYSMAGIMLRKYAPGDIVLERYYSTDKIISTSSIALQKAILTEYLPFLSNALLSNRVIQQPIKAIIRKGKSHYLCEDKFQEEDQDRKLEKEESTAKSGIIILQTRI